MRRHLRLLELLPIILLVRSRLPDRVECVELLLLRCDGAGGNLLLLLLDWNDLPESVLGHVLQLIARSVTLLHASLARALREDEELGFVLEQACHVPLQALHATVLAAMVNSDADGRGELHRGTWHACSSTNPSSSSSLSAPA